MRAYRPVQTWERAPRRFAVNLQQGEFCVVNEGRYSYVLAFCNGLRIHPLIEGVELQGFTEVKQEYGYVESWEEAPQKYNWTKLQTGELCVLEEEDASYVLAFCKGLRIHRKIPAASLPKGYTEVKREQYPSFKLWGQVPSEYEWVKKKLPKGKMTNVESHLIVHFDNGGFAAHRYLPYAEMPNFGYVRVARYPKYKDWRTVDEWVNATGEGLSYYEKFEIKFAAVPIKRIGNSLNNGEYTILTDKNWRPLVILAKEHGVCKITAYLDHADLKEIKDSFTFVPRS